MDFALSGQSIVTLTGRDAIAFAQAQFINDVGALVAGQWQWSGWLTPKGRVIALFALLKLDDETVWLLLPDAEPVAFVAALRRFVFRAKVVIEVRDDLNVDGRFAAAEQARGNALSRSEDGAVELDFGTAQQPRALRIGASPAPSDADAHALWSRFDLEHGLPRLPPSQAEQWTPQQLSLERLNGFSVKKGCYPGQEIVARTHFLGKAKRGLVRVESDDPLVAGSEIHVEGRPLGTLVCASGTTGLAVLPLDREPGALRVGGMALSEHPLLDGLAR